MERRQVVIIIVVVLLVLLYVLTLGYGLAKGDQKISTDSIADGFAGTLQGMLGGFAPGIDVGSLECNGQLLNRTFGLTRSHPSCVIKIPAEPKKKYRKATLTVTQPGSRPPAIYVRSSKSATARASGVRIKCLPDFDREDNSRLEVSYLPDGEDAPSGNDICWIKKKVTETERRRGKLPDVDISVMTDSTHKTRGAKLMLKRVCGGCSSSQYNIRLMLK
jgi:hypothetical protein